MIGELAPRVRLKELTGEQIEDQRFEVGGRELLIGDGRLRGCIWILRVGGLTDGRGPLGIIGVIRRYVARERGIDGVELVCRKGVGNARGIAIGAEDLDGAAAGPFSGDTRVDGPIPVGKTPGLSGTLESLADAGVGCRVLADDSREETGKELLVKRNVGAVPGGECVHYGR